MNEYELQHMEDAGRIIHADPLDRVDMEADLRAEERLLEDLALAQRLLGES